MQGRQVIGAAVADALPWRTAAPSLAAAAAILIVAIPASVAAFVITCGLIDPRPHDPWEAAMVVEGWRAAHGMPVYELQSSGHATTMYGPAEPALLGWLFRILPPTKLIPQLLSLASAIGLSLLGTAIFWRFGSRALLAVIALAFFGIDARVAYFAEGRPDMAGWLFGFAGLAIMFRAVGSRLQLSLAVLAAAFFVIGVAFKQTVAMLTLVPVLAACLEAARWPPGARVGAALIPALAVAAFFGWIAWASPAAFFYIVTVPSRYPVDLAAALKEIWRFFGQAACLLFALGVWLTAPATIAPGERRLVIWTVAAVALTIPAGALTWAKVGGTENSLIPALFALVTLSGLLVAPRCARQRRFLLMAALAFALTDLPDPWAFATAAGARSINQAVTEAIDRLQLDRGSYEGAVAYVRTLPGTAVSPEDPTITLAGKSTPSRSIFLQRDALGLPRPIPDDLQRRIADADYVVNDLGWWPRPWVFAGLGFTEVWSNGSYAVWRSPRDRRAS